MWLRRHVCQKFQQNDSSTLLIQNISSMTTCCNQIINSRYNSCLWQMTSFYDVIMTSCLMMSYDFMMLSCYCDVILWCYSVWQNLRKTTAINCFLKASVLITTFCNQRINSRYSKIAADSRRYNLVTSLRLVMSYCSVLSSAANLTKIDVLCVGTREDAGIIHYEIETEQKFSKRWLAVYAPRCIQDC